MELAIIGEFRALPGRERELEGALRKVVPQTRRESTCLAISAFRSNRDAAVFYVHSRWTDEAAFDVHATLSHTVEFIKSVEPLIAGHKVEVARLTQIA